MKRFYLLLQGLLIFAVGCGSGAYFAERFYKKLIYDLSMSYVTESLVTYKPALDFLHSGNTPCASFVLSSQMKMAIEISGRGLLDNMDDDNVPEYFRKSLASGEEFLRQHNYFFDEKLNCSQL